MIKMYTDLKWNCECAVSSELLHYHHFIKFHKIWNSLTITKEAMVLYVTTKNVIYYEKKKRPVLNLINSIILQHPVALFS